MVAATVIRFALLFLTVCNICTATELTDSLFSNSSRPYVIRLTKFLCINQPYKYTEVHICSLKFRQNKPPSFSLHMTFTKPTDSMHLSFTPYYKYNTFRPALPTVSYDVCKYLAEEMGKGTNKVADMITSFSKSQFGPFSRCPFYGRMNSTDVELPEEYLPAMVPAGDYRFDTRYYDDNNDTLIQCQLFFTVRAKGVIDLSMG